MDGTYRSPSKTLNDRTASVFNVVSQLNVSVFGSRPHICIGPVFIPQSPYPAYILPSVSLKRTNSFAYN